MASTIKDIAKSLNLSVSTVCYALNGGPKPVSLDVRERVLRAAKELDYHPNLHARSLITGRNMTVGIIFPTIEPNMMLSPFLHQAMNGIVNAAEELQQDILLLSAVDRNRLESQPNDVVDSRIDGVIFIAPPLDSKAVEVMAQKEMPFAVLDGRCRPPGMLFNVDNAGGVRQALDHLVSLGHRRIAHISGFDFHHDGIERLEAYRQYVRDAGLPVDERYVQPGNFHIEGGARAVEALMRLPKPPTAIFCANDGTAFGVIQTASELGFRVPEDLSVVGFDDHYMSSSFRPPLTTISQPVDAMGADAIHAIVSLMDGEQPSTKEIYPTALVARATTASAKEHHS